VVIRPQMTTFGTRSLAVKVKKTELDSYNQRLSDLKVIKDQGDTVQKTLQAMYLAMPKAAQIPEVLVMMENIGNNSGVVFNSVTLGTPTAATAEAQAQIVDTSGTVAEVPVAVSFTGNLDSVNKFLDAIRNNIRTATVKNQSLTADANGNLTVTMQLGLVYQGGV